MRASYVGRMSPAIKGGQFNPRRPANLSLWISGSDLGQITKAYQTITPTGSGTSGTTTITASATMATLGFVGQKLRIAGTDIYTLSLISTTTLTTVETLSATYNAGSALANDKISQILDKSSNSNTATQATADSQPTYIPNKKNGKSLMGFDSNNDGLSIASSSSVDNIFAAGGTMIFVFNPRGSGAAGSGRIFEKTNIRLLMNGATGLNFTQITSGTAGTWVTSGSQIAVNNYYILVMTYDASSVATAPKLYLNSNTAAGLTVSSAPTGTATSDASAALYIGNRSTLDRGFDGFIAEALAYKRVLTAAEIAQELTYWGNYYGITIS